MPVKVEVVPIPRDPVAVPPNMEPPVVLPPRVLAADLPVEVAPEDPTTGWPNVVFC